MQALHKTWFISDLHLDADHPEITMKFIKLLRLADTSVDAIYILGDLFEVWIGDDDPSAFHQEMLASLQQVTKRGIPIYFIRGNRDFLVGQAFIAKTGCKVLPDEAVIDLYGTQVLLMHGDTLCMQDQAYLRARKLMHNKFLQKLYLLLPIKLRQKIALRARQASTAHTEKLEAYLMDVTQSEVQRVMEKHQVDYLIHGHTHRPDTHQFTLNNHPKTRIVLPAWHDGGSVLEWSDAPSAVTERFLQRRID